MQGTARCGDVNGEAGDVKNVLGYSLRLV